MLRHRWTSQILRKVREVTKAQELHDCIDKDCVEQAGLGTERRLVLVSGCRVENGEMIRRERWLWDFFVRWQKCFRTKLWGCTMFFSFPVDVGTNPLHKLVSWDWLCHTHQEDMKRFIILMTGLSRESSWHKLVQMTQVRETSGFGFYCGWEVGQGFCGLNFKPVPREGSVGCLTALDQMWDRRERQGGGGVVFDTFQVKHPKGSLSPCYAQLCKHTKNSGIEHFKWVNFLVCILHLNKAI